MTTYVEEFILEGGDWVHLMGTPQVDPTPAPDPIAQRQALRDDGVLDGGITRHPYNSTLPALYSIDGSNTGLYPGFARSSLTVQPATTFSDTSATVKIIEGIWFQGNVKVTGKNYLFRNCFFNGPGGPTGVGALVDATGFSVENLVFEDCEWEKDFTLSGSVGITGHHFTLRRCNIHSVEDGFRPQRGNNTSDLATLGIQIFGTWIHDLLFYSDDSQYGGTQSDNMTHNDNGQFLGGGGILIQHCRIDGTIDPARGDASKPNVGDTGGSGHISGNPFYPDMRAPGANFMFSPNNAPIGDIVIRDCDIYGANAIFNMNPTYTTSAGLQVFHNIWKKKAKTVNFAWNSSKPGSSVYENYWGYTGDGVVEGTQYNG